VLIEDADSISIAGAAVLTLLSTQRPVGLASCCRNRCEHPHGGGWHLPWLVSGSLPSWSRSFYAFHGHCPVPVAAADEAIGPTYGCIRMYCTRCQVRLLTRAPVESDPSTLFSQTTTPSTRSPFFSLAIAADPMEYYEGLDEVNGTIV